ncbi:MAG: ECF transporter S component [Chloroflexi bacterium SZAS-1]|nr:ECF transporter S component [Chloroflexi bacterium SZAS-1]
MSQDRPTALNTRRIVVAGVLGAIAIVLGVTRLGFIPVPNLSGNATIMHIPAIIGAVLEGPIVGILAGGIFGVFSMIQGGGFFANPLISVVPRLLIGLTSWLAYRSLKPVNGDLAAAVAGIVGTLTNTILVVGAIILFAFGDVQQAAAQAGAPNLTVGAFVASIIPQAIAEIVIAAVLTPLVVRGVNLVRSGRTSASDTTPRDKSSF